MSDQIHADAGTEIGPGVRPLLRNLAGYVAGARNDPAELAARERYALGVLADAAAHPARTAELAADVANLVTGTQYPPALAGQTAAMPVVPAAEPGPEPDEPASEEPEPGRP